MNTHFSETDKEIQETKSRNPLTSTELTVSLTFRLFLLCINIAVYLEN